MVHLCILAHFQIVFLLLSLKIGYITLTSPADLIEDVYPPTPPPLPESVTRFSLNPMPFAEKV